MSNLSKDSLMIEGFLARMMYLSPHKMHRITLFGFFRVGVLSVANLFRPGTHLKIKLH